MSKPSPSPDMQKYFFRASAEDFQKIPGNSIVYWFTPLLFQTFEQGVPIGDRIELKAGMSTGDNTLFQRHWFEVEKRDLCLDCVDASDALAIKGKWFPCHSGGQYRKWYGNHTIIVNWFDDGAAIKSHESSAVRNETYYFRSGITWSKISSGKFAARHRPSGFLFDDTGRSGFADNEFTVLSVLALFCSTLSDVYLAALCPTLSFTSGELAKIPFIEPKNEVLKLVADRAVTLSRSDWDSYETSWDFTTLPLLRSEHRGETFEETYQNLRTYWQSQTEEMQRLEAENNRIFIEAYGLEDELTPEVPLEEITLTCNPHYRYRLSGKAWEGASDDEKNEERERRLVQDTVKEFVSYAVGCMFGRYSLEKEGLVLANQGETLADYLEQIPTPSFTPTEDNVLVVLDEDWFKDDIVACFQKFLKLTFGEKHYHTNLSFIEEALSNHKKSTSSLRDYFVKEFYKDHVQTYKKRPIYWMFSSPSGSFQALIYMHRYRTDTASVVLNDYLREYRDKLLLRVESLKAASDNEELSASARTRALKTIDKLKKVVAELDVYEKEELYPLATEQKSIDLDDGVQVNYEAFGMALKKF